VDSNIITIVSQLCVVGGRWKLIAGLKAPSDGPTGVCQLTSTHLTFPCDDGEAMLTSLREPRAGSRQTFEEHSRFQQMFIATSGSLIEANLFDATSVTRRFDEGILGGRNHFSLLTAWRIE
jgi:hypothetical protein